MKVESIRLLQVLWVLSATLLPVSMVLGIYIMGEESATFTILVMGVIWLIAVAVMQYLMCGKLSPFSSFDGSLTEED